MEFVLDAPDAKTWFRIETEAEAVQEAALMRHSVDRYFRREDEHARARYTPPDGLRGIERDIGLKAHLKRAMASFYTLRDAEGEGLATAMLPPTGGEDKTFRCIIVGPANADPYPEHAAAIEALGRRLGLSLTRARCYPYRGESA